MDWDSHSKTVLHLRKMHYYAHITTGEDMRSEYFKGGFPFPASLEVLCETHTFRLENLLGHQMMFYAENEFYKAGISFTEHNIGSPMPYSTQRWVS